MIDKEKIATESVIGADEVGTGEVLRPQVFVACYVNASQIEELKALGVKDSKKLTRDKAIALGGEIAKKVPYEAYSLRNSRLNTIYKNIPNLNQIKAIAHNYVIGKLYKRINNEQIDHIILDSFCTNETYEKYLTNPDKEILNRMLFIEKGEDANIAVAAASLIATFYQEAMLQEIATELNTEIPGGNTAKTTAFLKFLKETYGVTALEKYAKMNFSSTQKILKD